jgi:ATP-dependent RNA helicase DDX55/SPB4
VQRRPEPWKKHEVGAVVISPTRELATQTWQVLEHFLSGPVRLPSRFRSLLLVGGTDPAEDVKKFEEDGANILIATPGRLDDLLDRKSGGSNLSGHVRGLVSWELPGFFPKINAFLFLNFLNFLLLFFFLSKEVVVLDEADKLLEFGFERTVLHILSFLPKQRRTGLFSATQAEALNALKRTGMRNPVNVSSHNLKTFDTKGVVFGVHLFGVNFEPLFSLQLCSSF